MIILDTNIVSEVMRQAPAVQVVAWLNKQDSALLYLTAITIGELVFGLQILSDGRRRQRLESSLGRILQEAFVGRVLAYDERAALHYGRLMAARRKRGRPMSIADACIASIALAEGFVVATRNVAVFDDCGIELIDPFRHPA